MLSPQCCPCSFFSSRPCWSYLEEFESETSLQYEAFLNGDMGGMGGYGGDMGPMRPMRPRGAHGGDIGGTMGGAPLGPIAPWAPYPSRSPHILPDPHIINTPYHFGKLHFGVSVLFLFLPTLYISLLICYSRYSLTSSFLAPRT